jgi:hypothetical protein
MDDLKVLVALLLSLNGKENTGSSAYSSQQQQIKFDWDFSRTIISRTLFCY